uniref:(northern house mosquito) hypothetical protein n=1 Tax=Culex pipiens TaxID=7175 RepID=A0A8D8NPH3_CULPI
MQMMQQMIFQHNGVLPHSTISVRQYLSRTFVEAPWIGRNGPVLLPARKKFLVIIENAWVLNNILWADEGSFTCDGVFNTHNEHTWALENPSVVFKRTRNQRKFSVNTSAEVNHLSRT